jgi:hypothetical protein
MLQLEKSNEIEPYLQLEVGFLLFVTKSNA